jgi:hypothetical protein
VEAGKSSGGESSSGSGAPNGEVSGKPADERPSGLTEGVEPRGEVSPGHPAVQDGSEEHDDIEREEESEGDQLENPDENGDEEGEWAAASCPFCRKPDSCEHLIILWSGCNCNWDGRFPDASNDIEAELKRALWELFKAKRTGKGEWTYPLGELIEAAGDGWDEDPDNCDWWNPVCDYWFEVADGQFDCERVRERFDGGYPGSSDVFVYVYAKNPKAAIKGMMDDCRKDLEAIRAVLAKPEKRKSPKKH